MSVKTILKRYGLKFDEIREIDLRTTYHQYTPARRMDEFFGDTGLMMDGPHSEFAELYFQHGLKWRQIDVQRSY